MSKMKKYFLFLFVFVIMLIGKTINAQNTFKAFVVDEGSKQPLIYANVFIKKLQIGATTDSTGFVEIKNIPNGKQTIVFSYVGYRTKELTLTFPLKQIKPITISLEKSLDLQEVVVYSTRTNNMIKEIPIRVEVLGSEEVIEETAFNPGNISKLMGETSGVQLQHTSAISGNVSFRMQGLPGKYTQLLQDGFPLYSGFSSGLSLLQIPPLDLKQVEIVQGSSSILYGSDAIAGLVNLITKSPGKKPELSILLNQTHKGGSDLGAYYSEKNGNLGTTLLASVNLQKAVDVSGNSFADIPQYNRAVFLPKFFYNLNKHNRFLIGINTILEDRKGGNIQAINDKPDSLNSFYEQNKTRRINGFIKYENENENGNILTLKLSGGNFSRNLQTNVNMFSGVQNNIFAEVSYLFNLKNHKLVSGANFLLDDFKQNNPENFSLNYSYQTFGFFIQDNWKISNSLTIEPGLRFDVNQQKGNFVLPHVAILYKFTENFFVRFNGGFGYKLPTPFTDETERTRYQFVEFPSNLKAEKSKGANIDFNYKTPLFDDLFLNFNQSFFVTEIENPIIANREKLQNQIVLFENADGNLFSKGLNTNVRLSLDELILYVNYVYLDAKKSYDNNKQLEFTPNNRLTTTLAYEDEEEGWKAGLEAFFYGRQFTEEGKNTPNYWLLGASVQKRFGHFTLALNVENILDVRQTRFENIVSGNPNNPVFSEIYAPLEGIVGNIVLKFDLF